MIEVLLLKKPTASSCTKRQFQLRAIAAQKNCGFEKWKRQVLHDCSLWCIFLRGGGWWRNQIFCFYSASHTGGEFWEERGKQGRKANEYIYSIDIILALPSSTGDFNLLLLTSICSSILKIYLLVMSDQYVLV